MGLMNDLEFTNGIRSSFENRWTMEFWIFVEVVPQFINGINIIYVNHIGISVLTETENNQNLSIYCFPQDYLDKLSGSQGQEIVDLYTKSRNGMKDKIINGSNEWYFVRCGIDLTLMRKYLNDLGETAVKAENIYYGKENLNEYKYFKFPQGTKVRIENAAKNTQSRSFLRRIAIYRDYIPYELSMLKYK